MMKSKTTGALSGWIVWITVFGILSACIFPAAMLIGGLTSGHKFAIQTLAPIICPDGTTAQTYSYDTTTAMNMTILNQALLMNCIVLT